MKVVNSKVDENKLVQLVTYTAEARRREGLVSQLRTQAKIKNI